MVGSVRRYVKREELILHWNREDIRGECDCFAYFAERQSVFFNKIRRVCEDDKNVYDKN